MGSRLVILQFSLGSDVPWFALEQWRGRYGGNGFDLWGGV
jgi:hypothetical protein